MAKYIYKGTVEADEIVAVDSDNKEHKLAPMQGATAEENGEEGLAPKPGAGMDTMYLCGDGTYKSIPQVVIDEEVLKIIYAGL